MNTPELTMRRLVVISVCLTLAVVVLGFLFSLIGPMPLDDVWWNSRIWWSRLSRLGGAAVVGAALAGSGLALQALLRNPLAEPYILGVASGAGVGVLLGNTVAAGLAIATWLATPGLAFLGAMTAVVTVYLIAQRAGRIDPYVMLLSGVIVNVFNGALIFLLILLLEQADLVKYVGWGMGQIPESLWFEPWLLILAALLTATGLAVLMCRAMAFNVLNLGDDVARSAGVRVEWLRFETFVVVSMMTVGAVTLAGPIGFVGLIVPHMCRLIVGPDHRTLLILCAGGGAIFLMTADTACRFLGEWMRLGEMPVGVVTALIGGPLFIYLLKRQLHSRA